MSAPRGKYTAPTLGRLADGMRPAEHVPGQLELIGEAALRAAAAIGELVDLLAEAAEGPDEDVAA